MKGALYAGKQLISIVWGHECRSVQPNARKPFRKGTKKLRNSLKTSINNPNTLSFYVISSKSYGFSPEQP